MAREMNLWKRLSTDSPKFFNRLKAIALSLAGVATIVIGATKTVPGFTLPENVITLLTYLIVAGAAIAGTAQTTVK